MLNNNHDHYEETVNEIDNIFLNYTEHNKKVKRRYDGKVNRPKE